MDGIVNKFNGRVFVDFLSKEECELFLAFAKDTDMWADGGDPIYNNRIIHLINYKNDDDVKAKSIEVRDRIKEAIIKEYKFENIYEDTIQIVRWYEDLFQPPHADACNPDGSDNGLTFREIGAVIYLNDNYDGGKTYYTKYGIEVTPKAGTLIMHPSDLDHNHGVTTIKGNIRYTMASFWTKDITFANVLPQQTRKRNNDN